jgi:hypothetical protein
LANKLYRRKIVKSIRQFCAAFLLTLVLALTALAGDMSFPGIATADQAPSPPNSTAAGDMHTPDVTSESVVEVALGFLLDVASLV